MVLLVGDWLSHINQKNNKRVNLEIAVFKILNIFNSLIWVIRAIVINLWLLISVDIVDNLIYKVKLSTFWHLNYQRGMGKEDFSYFTYRESTYALAQLIFWLIALFTAIFWRQFFWFVVFFLSALAVSFGIILDKNR